MSDLSMAIVIAGNVVIGVCLLTIACIIGFLIGEHNASVKAGDPQADG